MRVHVVCITHEGDQVLARYARALLSLPGFTSGKEPSPDADINYFLPYLLRTDFPDFVGVTAGWFTHREDTRPRKVDWWYQAAETLDLRLTSAPMYEADLAKYGATEVVTPFVERDHFLPKRNVSEVPTVGFSGYVYQGGRKGEALAGQFAKANGEKMNIIASGKGWPVKTKEYTWDKLPDFYNRLDVYVCTASIEGVPVPPLEALSCGVPIVIPRGVGMLDWLPSIAGIHRYDVGDYEGMEQAVMDALIDDYDPTALRRATERYTEARWRDEHAAVFEQFMYRPLTVNEPEAWAGQAGIYYVAYGKPARECVQKALEATHHYMPTVQTALVSETALGDLPKVFIEEPDADIGARSVKTRIYDLAPADWKYVIYMDADTELVADVSFLFDLLAAGWDMFICLNPARYALLKDAVRPDNHEEMDKTFDVVGTEEILQLNGGVFGFQRNERMAKFMRAWHREWDVYGKRDQAALTRVLYSNPVRLYVLGQEWNTVLRYSDRERTAGVLHHPLNARRWKGIIDGRLDTTEAWAAVHPERE